MKIFNQLGLFTKTNDWITINEVLNRINCDYSFVPSVKWALEFVVQEGFIRKNKIEYSLINNKTSIKKPTNFNLKVSLNTIDFISKNWLDVVRGNISPLHLLFRNNNGEIWRTYFGQSNSLYKVHNEWIANYLSGQKLASNMTILELGAGYGSGTREAINKILDKKINYLASDLSNAMCKFIKDKTSYDYLDTLIVNFDKDIALQVNNREFDYILAINALHCSKDILATLNSIKKSLKKGGSLILSECIRDFRSPLMHQEFIFNLLPGYTQKRNNEYFIQGFYYEDDWINVLKDAGFIDINIDLNSGPKKLGAIIKGTI